MLCDGSLMFPCLIFLAEVGGRFDRDRKREVRGNKRPDGS